MKGDATITLRELESGGANTIVDVTGTAQTGGTIARLGQRLIGSAAKMMQDRFFACMQSKAARARQSLKTSPKTLRTRQRLFHRAPHKHRNHRLAIIRARVQIGIQVGDVAAAAAPAAAMPSAFLPASAFSTLAQVAPHASSRR